MMGILATFVHRFINANPSLYYFYTLHIFVFSLFFSCVFSVSRVVQPFLGKKVYFY